MGQKAYLKKSTLIFDGECWLPIPKLEFQARHPDTKMVTEYLDNVLGNRHFTAIVKNLGLARKKISQNTFYKLYNWGI